MIRAMPIFFSECMLEVHIEWKSGYMHIYICCVMWEGVDINY